jgi:hypothetical protein
MIPKKMHILELCCEDAYGSWEFWSDRNNKTIEELGQILQTLIELVQTQKLEILTHVAGGPYVITKLDIERLRIELQQSTIPNVNPDTFYWFEATHEGRQEYYAWAKEYWTPERKEKRKRKPRSHNND